MIQSHFKFRYFVCFVMSLLIAPFTVCALAHLHNEHFTKMVFDLAILMGTYQKMKGMMK